MKKYTKKQRLVKKDGEFVSVQADHWNKPRSDSLSPVETPAGQSENDQTDRDEAVRREMVEILPRLQRFGCALTGTIDEGNDLVQEACTRALLRIEQWQPGTRLDSWMFRIIHNIWRDRLRAAKVRGTHVDIDDIHTLSGVDGRTVLEERSDLAVVMKGIENLPEEQKVLIALICVDGLSYKEAADIVDIPIGTVMSRLARARKTLNKWLQSHEVLTTASNAEN